MKNWALAALFLGAVGVGACGGDDSDKNPPVTIRDGGGADATGNASCNPVDNSGCDAGEKCSAQYKGQDADDVAIFQTQCGPAGTALRGEACMRAADDSDDCAVGLGCFGTGDTGVGVCEASCTIEGTNGCTQDDVCIPYINLFNDVDQDPNNPLNFGLCEQGCDPLSQKLVVNGEISTSNCPGDVACNVFWGNDNGRGLCRGSTANVEQDDECEMNSGGGCAIDACAPGFDSLPETGNRFDDTQGPWCLGLCKPVNTYMGADPLQPAGDPAFDDCTRAGVLSGGHAPYSCRFVTFYSNIATPTAYGLCTPAVLGDLGDCTTFALDPFVEALNGDGTDDNQFYCRGGVEGGDFDTSICPQGCVSDEFLNALFPEPAMANRAKRLTGLLGVENAKIQATFENEVSANFAE